MNSKKNLWGLFTLIMFAIMSVGFVSCGDDDDDTTNGNDGVSQQQVASNSLIGTWRKYSSSTVTDELGHILWEFNADGTMYEHDIDDNLNIIEGKTETFKYKTENGHLYTQKQKEGKEYSWKDEGAYTITNNVLEVTKDSGKANRYLKIK